MGRFPWLIDSIQMTGPHLEWIDTWNVKFLFWTPPVASFRNLRQVWYPPILFNYSLHTIFVKIVCLFLFVFWFCCVAIRFHNCSAALCLQAVFARMWKLRGRCPCQFSGREECRCNVFCLLQDGWVKYEWVRLWMYAKWCNVIQLDTTHPEAI